MDPPATRAGRRPGRRIAPIRAKPIREAFSISAGQLGGCRRRAYRTRAEVLLLTSVALVVFGAVWCLMENAFVELWLAQLVLAPAALNRTPPDA